MNRGSPEVHKVARGSETRVVPTRPVVRGYSGGLIGKGALSMVRNRTL